VGAIALAFKLHFLIVLRKQITHESINLHILCLNSKYDSYFGVITCAAEFICSEVHFQLGKIFEDFA